MTTGDRIRIRREELGMTQEELAEKIGYKSRTSINKIEMNSQNLTQSKIKQVADVLRTSPAYIMGWEDADGHPLNKKRTVKIYGRIAAGAPIEMIENVIDEVDLNTLPEKYDGLYYGQIHRHV